MLEKVWGGMEEKCGRDGDQIEWMEGRKKKVYIYLKDKLGEVACFFVDDDESVDSKMNGS